MNMQSELWRHNFVDTITQAYESLAQNKNYQIDVERVDYCASHMQLVSSDDVDMADIDDQQ